MSDTMLAGLRDSRKCFFGNQLSVITVLYCRAEATIVLETTTGKEAKLDVALSGR